MGSKVSVSTPKRKNIKYKKGFLEEQSYIRALGMMTARDQKILDTSDPGWYDKWEKAAPMSKAGFRRRNAITDGTLPKIVQVLNHRDDPSMTFHLLGTGRSLEAELSGTDEEMRVTVTAVLVLLLQRS